MDLKDDNPYEEKIRAIHRDILKKLGPTSSDRSRMGWQRTAKYASIGRLSYVSSSLNNKNHCGLNKELTSNRQEQF